VGRQATRPSAQRFIDLHGDSENLLRLCDTAWSLSDGTYSFGVLGYVTVRPGYAVGWAMFDQSVANISSVELTRKIQSGLQVRMAREGLCRMESSIDVTDSTALRWARLLGFEIEGLMRKSSSINTDQWLIARIME